MADDCFSIAIEGCWKDMEEENSQIPEYSGVFFVFEAKSAADGLVPLRLIYVGGAENVHDGILTFVKKFQQLRYLRYGNSLCYFTAAVDRNARERVQAAFIYAHKPPANNRYKYIFPFAQTHIISTGKIGFLKENFRV